MFITFGLYAEDNLSVYYENMLKRTMVLVESFEAKLKTLALKHNLSTEVALAKTKIGQE